MTTLPVDRRVPTSGLGAWLARRSDGHRLHAGVDLRVDAEQFVRAPEAGRVVEVFESNRPRQGERRFSRPPGWSGYGPRGVLIESPQSGVWHLLAHLDRVLVQPGDTVAEGQSVGQGSAVHHVHWEVRTMARPTRGAAVVEVTLDPGAYLEGRRVPWSGQCPESPNNSRDTPRACRPSNRGRAVPPLAPGEPGSHPTEARETRAVEPPEVERG